MTQPRRRRERHGNARRPRGRWGWPEWAAVLSPAVFVLGVALVTATTDPARPHQVSGPAEAGAALVLLALAVFAVALPVVLWRLQKARRSPRRAVGRPQPAGAAQPDPQQPRAPQPLLPAPVPPSAEPPIAGPRTLPQPPRVPGVTPARVPATLNGPGFAVVDLETTGLYPSTDRVVEVAVIHLDADGEVTGEFSTLINPGRDVGPTHLHGIKAADVHDAPVFADAAAVLWQLLSGRVLAAHNASFDTRFLAAEFARCGLRLPSPPVMCTMQLARHYLPNLPGRSLPACCAAAGIPLSGHHSALADAHAAAGLLACYRRAHRELPESWEEALLRAARTPWPAAPHAASFRPVTRREQATRRAAEQPMLATFTATLPRGTSDETDAYLAVLDQVLEDRNVTASEFASLSQLAGELGLSRDAAERASREYLHQVAAAAWRDSRVTAAELADLLEVARLLGIPDGEARTVLEHARQAPPQPQTSQTATLQPGDKVVFTGQMNMTRAEAEALATAAGLRVMTSVSRRTALVVAADPYSQSGKAKLAREHDVRMVTEQVFLYMLDRIQTGPGDNGGLTVTSSSDGA